MTPQKINTGRFINASAVKTKKERINYKKVDNFILKFNKEFLKGENSGDEFFYLNNGLDKIELLNDNEFNYAVKLAKDAGWELTQSDDNYQTTSYQMKKIK